MTEEWVKQTSEVSNKQQLIKVERTKKRCFDKSKRLAVATVAALLHRQQQQDFF
jgi:hypothetical protein